MGEITTRRGFALFVLVTVVSLAFVLTSCVRFDGVVDFEADPVSGRRPLTIQFTPLVQGDIDRYIWNFGDGTVSTERTPEHTYSGGGNYTVMLTVIPRQGNPTTARKDDYITVTSGFGTQVGARLFWTRPDPNDSDRSLIQRVSMDNNGNAGEIATVLGVEGWSIKDIVLGGSQVLWVESKGISESRVRSARASDGSDVETIKTGSEYSLGIEVSAWCDYESETCEYIVYWAEFFQGEIIGRDIIHGIERTLVTGRVNPRNLALDSTNNMLYWTEEGAILRTSAVLPGPNSSNKITSLVAWVRPQGFALDLDGGKMYWAENGKIRRANLDGTEIETILQVDTYHIAVDHNGNRLYWVDGGRIKRAHLDGTNVETVVDGLGNPGGLHVVGTP